MSDEAVSERDPLGAVQRAQQAQQAQQARPGKRERIVLAKQRRTRRVVRTLAEVEEQTGVGEVWVRQLVRAQLILALRLGLLTVAVLGAIPLAFALLPSWGAISVAGLRLPWLLLGFGVYPFLLAVGWAYHRSAERNEQDFIELVES